MRFKEKVSKKNINFLLIAALAIGIIVIVTQMANVGSQKNQNQSAQNTDLNQSANTTDNSNIKNTSMTSLSKPLGVTNSTSNETKPLGVTNSTSNETKPLGVTDYKGFNNTNLKYSNETTNLQTVKEPNKGQSLKKLSVENKDNNDKNSKDKGFLLQKDEKVPTLSDKIIKKTKDKTTDKPKHIHKSINQKDKNTDSNKPTDTNLNDFSNPS
ncbi:MAG: hypothetical protein ACTHKK_04740, partial [Candidatus Nitrosocosmicus sp.]